MASKIISSDRSYIYPMANSLRGGAVASEYNIRSLFGVLLSKSSAKSEDDFTVSVDDSESWYNCNLVLNSDNEKVLEFSTTKFNINPGTGNCNGYYVELSDVTSFNFSQRFNISKIGLAEDLRANELLISKDYTIYLGIYLRIIYSGTGICDGVYFWAGTQDEVNTEFDKIEKYGFYDIGIHIGNIQISYGKAYESDQNNLNGSDIGVRYISNPHIMACIDMNRLGTANGSIAEQLYNKLNRLYSLMIDAGALTIGVPIVHANPREAFDPEPGSNNHDFNKISPIKVQMYINQKTDELGAVIEDSDGYHYVGGLQVLGYNENTNEFNSNGNEVLTFDASVIKNTGGITTKIHSINIFNNQCIFDSRGFTAKTINVDNIYIGSELTEDKITEGSGSVPGDGIITIVPGEKSVEFKTKAGNSITFKTNILEAETINAKVIEGNRVVGAVWL